MTETTGADLLENEEFLRSVIIDPSYYDLVVPPVVDHEGMMRVVVDPAYTHADTEHPIDAPIVRDCFDKNGPYVQFQIEAKKRYLRVCVIDGKSGIIGFQIVDIVEGIAKEKTAYIKETLKSLGDIFKYAASKGYPRFKGPL